MSSANLIEVIGLPEAAYGKTPPLDATADGITFRFTSETLSGTPKTVESAALRTDRMSGGQVVVGLDSGGDLNFELAADPTFDMLFQMAMMNDWQTGDEGSDDATLAISGANPQSATIVFSTLDIDDFDTMGTPIAVGDVMILSGFTDPANNGTRQVTGRTPPHTLTLAIPKGGSDVATAEPIGWKMPDYVEIGAKQVSLSLSKAYKDVLHLATPDEHSQRYSGSIVSALKLAIDYGAIITGTATFMANGYVQETPSMHQQIDAGGGAVAAPGTSNPLNASIDAGTVTVGGQPTDFCIEKLSVDLDNGLTPQNCIGQLAPTRYALGTAAIKVTTSIYLGDAAYDTFMPNKLTQEPISLLVAASNEDGGYAVQLTALQLSFPDPAAGGANQQVMIEASGTAKVGPGGSSSMRIYRL